jgi:hypothetical protein
MDPAGYVDGASLYEYCRSDPEDRTDWEGLACSLCSGVGSKALAGTYAACVSTVSVTGLGPSSQRLRPHVDSSCNGVVFNFDDDGIQEVLRQLKLCGCVPTIKCSSADRCAPDPSRPTYTPPCGFVIIAGRARGACPSLTLCLNSSGKPYCDYVYDVNRVVAHELYHVLQACKYGGPIGCNHSICREVQAYDLGSRDCAHRTTGSPEWMNCICLNACRSAKKHCEPPPLDGTTNETYCFSQCKSLLQSNQCRDGQYVPLPELP